jgi:hypothetical protein
MEDGGNKFLRNFGIRLQVYTLWQTIIHNQNNHSREHIVCKLKDITLF